ncbi:hypothetical protein [Cribrihabitans neustonicus]|uniref:DUF7742 family protein n=1 Tax=Cribrihabitans neustonicus TaxID=1429085 RepID=UPI003B5A3795
MLPSDCAAVARALLAAPVAARPALCRRIFAGAAEAAVHMACHRRLHPRWGDGSLSAAARRFRLADEPFLDDPEFLSCTRLVLTALAARISERPAAPPAR